MGNVKNWKDCSENYAVQGIWIKFSNMDNARDLGLSTDSQGWDPEQNILMCGLENDPDEGQ